MLAARQRRIRVFTLTDENGQDDRADSLSGHLPNGAADDLNDLSRPSFGVDQRDRVDARDVHTLAENLDVGQQSVDVVALGKAREQLVAFAPWHAVAVDGRRPRGGRGAFGGVKKPN